VDGKKTVSIFGEKIDVRASIHTLGGFSAHAGQTELLNWYATLAPSKPRVVLTHGEDRAREPLAKLLNERFGVEAARPKLGDVIEI
jgi:metallo-beta-lactamase family protein